MLLCGSCNRAKSWSCEHCPNWREVKSPDVCKTCYWGNPECYKHLALRKIRRADIVWSETEVECYEKLKLISQREETPLPEFIKSILASKVDSEEES